MEFATMLSPLDPAPVRERCFALRKRGSTRHEGAMGMRVFEFRFPNGDFEIDARARVPHVGDVIWTRGRAWKVDRIEPRVPSVVVLRPAQMAQREVRIT